MEQEDERRDTAKIQRYRTLGTFWRWILIAFTISGLALAINQIFIVKPRLDNEYLYWLIAAFLSMVFIVFPATRKAPRNKVPWYDALLFLLTVGIASYFALSAWPLAMVSYMFQAPLHMTVGALIFCLLALEAVRRAGGVVLFLFTGLFACYPMVAHLMPGVLQAVYFPPELTIRYHALGLDSILGLPMQVVGKLLIGFMVFGVVLVATGGGKFFIDLASALFGSQRGGPAKVSVFASALFGSLSGSVISNVVTTGSITIPTMKKAGYPSYYAAAVEACASTGGCIMPPIMGAVAFLMASFLDIPYFQVVIAAAIPSVLYYTGLFTQVDAYAGRNNLKGLIKSQIPRLRSVLKDGWPYILAFAVLVYLLYLRREGQAPFISSAFLLTIVMVRKETRLNFKGFLRVFENSGQLMAEITGMLAACGFIIGSLSITGLASSLSRELVMLAGGIPIAMLFFGAIASSILGMGMTISACYIFLAIILVPGLTAVGFNTMAVHLFVLYWGLASFITPPVAVGAYTAAGIAGANPIRTGLKAMRLGSVLYIVPFFFVFCPALVLQETILEAILPFFTCVIGIILLAGALEGFLLKVGILSVAYRVLFFVSGLLLAIPNWQTDIVGAGIAVMAILSMMIKRHKG